MSTSTLQYIGSYIQPNHKVNIPLVRLRTPAPPGDYKSVHWLRTAKGMFQIQLQFEMDGSQ